jgi:hypothetical protein
MEALFGGQAGALRDGTGAGVVGVKLDAVELVGEVAPGVTAGISAMRISRSANQDSCA